MNTINNISCQPLQPKNQTSFKGKKDDEAALLALAKSESVDDFMKDSDAIQQVSNAVVGLADKGNKGAEALGTLAMLAGIGAGGYFVASKAAKRVLSSLSGKTQYLDGIGDKAASLFKKMEGRIQNVDLGENPGKVKKGLVGFAQKVPEKLRKIASKGIDDDTLRKNFAKKLSKGAADLNEQELANFPEWLKRTKDLDLDIVKDKFVKEAGKKADEISVDTPEFTKWISDNMGIDLGMAKSEYAKTLPKTVNDLTADDLVEFNNYRKSVMAKNALTQIIGNIFGFGAGTKAVAEVGRDEDSDGIPDGLQKQTIQQKFNETVGAMVLENSKDVF